MQIRGDFSAFEAESRRLDEVVERAVATVASEQRQMEEFLSAGWTGPSAETFGRAFTEWARVARQSTDTLQRLVAGIRATAQAQQADEEQNTDEAAQIAAALPAGPSITRMMRAS